MPRFAVLHDLATDDTPPVGLVLEMKDYVLVHAPRDFGIPERQDGEYRVLDPELIYVTYRPGDTGYFEQVLGSLSWAFGVGDSGEVPVADDKTLLQLIVRKVDKPRDLVRVGEYDVALTFPRDHAAAPADARAACGPRSAYEPEPSEEFAIAAKGGGVVAA